MSHVTMVKIPDFLGERLTQTAFAVFLSIALVVISLGIARADTLSEDQRHLDALNSVCRAAGGPNSETEQACDAADKFAKHLETRGFCVYGHGVIGFQAKSHCYAA
jgi:hypothetical protein